MAKLVQTAAIHIRLPAPLVQALDRAAEVAYESRSRLAARIITDWLKRHAAKGDKN